MKGKFKKTKPVCSLAQFFKRRRLPVAIRAFAPSIPTEKVDVIKIPPDVQIELDKIQKELYDLFWSWDCFCSDFLNKYE